MVPTIQPGDRILVNKTAYRSEDVKVGDVVVFANPEKPSLTFIKRVIALSGDEVQISGGNLTINGIIVPDRATATTPDFGPITVPQYNCFVLGDNVDMSKDSRHFGPIPLATIGGQASIVYWPPFRSIHPAESNRENQ